MRAFLEAWHVAEAGVDGGVLVALPTSNHDRRGSRATGTRNYTQCGARA
jgi:hypothetical protein